MERIYKRLTEELKANEAAEKFLTQAIAETRIEMRNKKVEDEVEKEALSIMKNAREALTTVIETKIKVINEIADIELEESFKGK